MATYRTTSSRRTTILREINGQHYQLTLEIHVRKVYILVEKIINNKSSFVMESDLFFENDLGVKEFDEMIRMKERDLAKFIIESFRFNLGMLGVFE